MTIKKKSDLGKQILHTSVAVTVGLSRKSGRSVLSIQVGEAFAKFWGSFSKSDTK